MILFEQDSISSSKISLSESDGFEEDAFFFLLSNCSVVFSLAMCLLGRFAGIDEFWRSQGDRAEFGNSVAAAGFVVIISFEHTSECVPKMPNSFKQNSNSSIKTCDAQISPV